MGGRNAGDEIIALDQRHLARLALRCREVDDQRPAICDVGWMPYGQLLLCALPVRVNVPADTMPLSVWMYAN